MASPRSDLYRSPLSESGLRRALARTAARDGAPLWRALTVTGETTSTNDDLVAAARDGAEEGAVLVAEAQTAGRGRHERVWVSSPSVDLTFSVLLRPDVPMRHWGWLPLLAGVATVKAVADRCGLPTLLKWPNDVLMSDPPRKVAGILASVVPSPRPALVLGIGINVNAEPHHLPGTDATSLAIERAAPVDRAELLLAVLTELAVQYDQWRFCGGDAEMAGIRQEYRRYSHTVGRQIKLKLPDGSCLAGTPVDVDTAGRLVVAAETGLVAVSAADVINLR